jgi:hypothetical protein
LPFNLVLVTAHWFSHPFDPVKYATAAQASNKGKTTTVAATSELRRSDDGCWLGISSEFNESDKRSTLKTVLESLFTLSLNRRALDNVTLDARVAASERIAVGARR